MLFKLEVWSIKAARTWSQIGLAILVAYAFATLFDGMSRWIFAYPLDAVRDCGGPAIAMAISACFPQAFLEKSNIVITFVDSFLSRSANKRLTVLASIATTLAILVVAWRLTLLASNLARAGDVTPMLRIPVAPFWFIVALNMWFTALAQVVLTIIEIGGGPRIHRLAEG